MEDQGVWFPTRIYQRKRHNGVFPIPSGKAKWKKILREGPNLSNSQKETLLLTSSNLNPHDLNRESVSIHANLAQRVTEALKTPCLEPNDSDLEMKGNSEEGEDTYEEQDDTDFDDSMMLDQVDIQKESLIRRGYNLQDSSHKKGRIEPNAVGT